MNKGLIKYFDERKTKKKQCRAEYQNGVTKRYTNDMKVMQNLIIKELAEKYNTTTRTIYRWIKKSYN